MARASLTILLAVLLPSFVAAPPAAAVTRVERRMLDNLNDARGDHDLPPLRLDRGLSRAARHSAERMEREGRLEHTDDLAEASGAERTSENIGWVREPGLSPRHLAGRLHRGFLRSSRHRRNVLGDFTHVGVGVAVGDDDTMWMSVIFARD